MIQQVQLSASPQDLRTAAEAGDTGRLAELLEEDNLALTLARSFANDPTDDEELVVESVQLDTNYADAICKITWVDEEYSGCIDMPHRTPRIQRVEVTILYDQSEAAYDDEW